MEQGKLYCKKCKTELNEEVITDDTRCKKCGNNEFVGEM